MRQAVFRTRKYESKMDPDAIRSRFLAQKDSMVEQEEAIFAEIVEVERKAKRVCEAAGLPSMVIPAYLNFARQCYKYSKNFSQTTQLNEVYHWYVHWSSRGFNATVLASIAELCGVDIAEYGLTGWP